MSKSENLNTNLSEWNDGDISYLGLDRVDFVPVTDELFNSENISEAVAEGRYLEAGLSLVTEIAIVGKIIDKDKKNAKKISPCVSLQIIKAVKNLDIPKFAKKLNSNSKLVPHVDKISGALQKWQNDISQNFGKIGANVGMVKYPVTVTGTIINTNSTETVKNDETALSKIFDKVNNKINLLAANSSEDSAIFYADKAKDKPSRQAAEDASKTSGEMKENITKTDLDAYLADTDTQQLLKQLPPKAQDLLWIKAARKFAQNVKGNVKFVGDIGSITPDKIFYRVEIDAVLENAEVSESSKLEFQRIKQKLDAGFEGDKNVHH